MFDECFNVAPYYLKYPDEELWNIYANHFKKGFVLFAYSNEKIIGFAGSRPLINDEYVADDVKSFFSNINNYWYHSELGVSIEHRGKGLAQKLIQETIKHTPENKKIIMRTKENNIPSIKIHEKMGFALLENITQIIERKDSCGKDIYDKRIYMIYEPKMFKPSKLYVDIPAIKHNLKQIQKEIGNKVEIMPVLKAHAYGIGFPAVAEAIKDYRIVAVATVAEAVELQEYFHNEIFILYQPSIEDIPLICKNKFEIATTNDIEFLEELNKQASTPIKIHINVETGSGILGIQIKDLKELCKKIKKYKNIIVNGIFMHYSCSESLNESDIEFSNEQSDNFIKAIKIAEEELGKAIPYKHAGCSSATFAQPKTRYNLVRMGLIIYGYGNLPHLTKYIEIKPTLRFTTKIIQIETFLAGSYFGYNRTFKAEKEMKVATIAAGYADGINTKLSNKGSIIINGQKAPIVGRVCMNLTMCDITNIKGKVKFGDEVAIFDNTNITINDLAEVSETNIAECMMHIGQTVERKIIV